MHAILSFILAESGMLGSDAFSELEDQENESLRKGRKRWLEFSPANMEPLSFWRVVTRRAKAVWKEGRG
jgi:hypothetical protein